MKLSALLAVALFLITESMESAERSEFIRFKTERVIVFKDGHALFIRKGTAVTDAEGEIHTSEVPDAAVLGSFWSTAKEGELSGMRAGWVTEQTTNAVMELCQNHFQVLAANKGRRCEVILTDRRTVKGVIRETVGASRSTQIDEASLPGFSSLAGSGTGTVAGARVHQDGAFVVISGETGDHFLPVANIGSVTVPEMELRTRNEIVVKRREKRLTFRFAKPRAKREITLMYFRPGIRWIPTYRINLPEDGKQVARVVMQAELINEAEDLQDTPVDIVVGVPNFRFKSAPSPLVLEGVMRNALRQALPALMGQMGNGFANSAYSQRASEFHRPVEPVATAAVQLPAELTAARAQDLFVYSLPALRLGKGDRMAVKIFETAAPFRDVYTWDLPITRHDIATSPSNEGTSPLKLSENRIWRQIELTNTTSIPWTTGAAMIMRDRQPLAQELLAYTSVGSRCRVPVTVSIDTQGSVAEKEIGRKLSALTWDRYKYALIQNESVISVTNRKPQPIALELTVRLGGGGLRNPAWTGRSRCSPSNKVIGSITGAARR
jgi:hypothetical protein